ncbi:hypothetical protein J5N97_011429 [Dioscorea zingiberensis]|uniref:t-SNARE coiled-coil homology domain-containing protein n=1 Tax=Dioscorea zingiberensis TaxID=325984 RepID=A0A9D5D221_9LILI|nr:hypothetical protein J5N97_011429 [Dioscorea zingiberensis]
MTLRTLILSLVLLLAISSSASSSDDLVAELVALRARSPSGVIHLDDRAVSRFLTSAPTPRPFSLLVFFDAAQLREKPDLHLPQLRSEFGLLSSSFSQRNPSSSSLFFCDIEFQESQSSFHLFGVSSLPHIRLVSPHHSSPKDSDAMDQSDFARLAESMAEFVESRTGLEVGPINRPPPLSTKQIFLLISALVVSSPFLIKRALAGDTLLHDRKLWMSLAVFVYFFSVSGTMHNIIRKMPMFIPDRGDPNRLVFFYQGSGMQLGAEGFAVGFLYTVVGLALAATTHGLVRLKNVKAQRGYMLLSMLVAYWAVSKEDSKDNAAARRIITSSHSSGPLYDSFVMSIDQAPRGRNIELGTQSPMLKADHGMENFFKQVKEVENLMEKLSKQLQRLQEANEESKTVTQASAMKEIKRRMEKDVDDGGKVARCIKQTGKKIGCEKGSGVDRSRMAMTAGLKKKLKDRMNDFQKLRETIQNEYREVVERRVFTVTGSQPTDEMIDNLIENGNSEQIFQKAIQEMGRGQVTDTLKEIQERHDAVRDIETKLLDLHQVFMDMAVLVEAQGEMLDNIEIQVTNAKNHIESGNGALHTAKKLQKSSRKCMVISVLILIIIAIIIALSVLKPWK